MFKLRVSKGLAVDSIHSTWDPEAAAAVCFSAGGTSEVHFCELDEQVIDPSTFTVSRMSAAQGVYACTKGRQPCVDTAGLLMRRLISFLYMARGLQSAHLVQLQHTETCLRLGQDRGPKARIRAGRLLFRDTLDSLSSTWCWQPRLHAYTQARVAKD